MAIKKTITCETTRHTILKTSKTFCFFARKEDGKLIAVIKLKPASNEDESRWELAGESLHECFLNSHCSVKWAVRVAWELTRVFLLFSISLFLLVTSPLLFLRFLTLVKLSHYSNCHLLMIRNNIFFFFFFFLWVMTWKSLASGTLYDYRVTLMTVKTSQTSHWLSSKFEPARSWWECMRVHESWRSIERELRLSSSFDQAFTLHCTRIVFYKIKKFKMFTKKAHLYYNYTYYLNKV